MNSAESHTEKRKLFLNVIVVTLFVGLLGVFAYSMYESGPNIEKVALRKLQERFSTSVNNAHWQWQAEGRPTRILLIHYDELQRETSRKPIEMSHLGWPKAEPNRDGCEKLWEGILDIPLTVNTWKVRAEFYDGEKISDNALDSFCRYQMSLGHGFEYSIYKGKVTPL
jgi:hypothetical protein